MGRRRSPASASPRPHARRRAVTSCRVATMDPSDSAQVWVAPRSSQSAGERSWSRAVRVVHATPVSRSWRGAAAVAVAHAVPVIALCWDMVLLGHVPYVRDVLFLYVPDFAFLARSLAQRVWPLW